MVMPLWLTIIFAIIGDMPQIISVFKEFYHLFKKAKPADQQIAKDQVKLAFNDVKQARSDGSFDRRQRLFGSRLAKINTWLKEREADGEPKSSLIS